tara:strand:+ start:18392 stop:18916 length:525 start_codon:yes stop_codon:yes gene_type:complete
MKPKNSPLVGGVAVEFTGGGDLLIPRSVAAEFFEIAQNYRPPNSDPADPDRPIFLISATPEFWIATPQIENCPAYKNSAAIYTRGQYTIPPTASGIDRAICAYRLNSLIAALARKFEDLADLAAGDLDPALAAELGGEIRAEWAGVVQNRRNQLRRATAKCRSRPSRSLDRAAL